MDKHRIKIRLIRLSFFISIALMAIKFVAYFITHSTAILTDAVESIVNVVASGFAFYSIYLASQPKDVNHPYGHGKVEFFSAGIEGVLIVLAGLFILTQSTVNFFYPKTITDLAQGMGLLSIAALINGILGYYLLKAGRSHQSLTLEADGKHLLTDFYSSLVLLAGVLIIYISNWFWMDSLLSFGFSFFILYNGYKLVRSSVSGLMDESDQATLQRIASIINQKRKPSWIDIHNMRVLKYGADLHIDCHITLPNYWNLQEVHNEIEALEDGLEQELQSEMEIFIHADPCIPVQCCKYCRVADCEIRIEEQSQSIEWNIENLSRNQKHYHQLLK